jgi:hypothetical protein
MISPHEPFVRSAGTVSPETRHTINAHKHPWLQWDSNPLSVEAGEDSSCLGPNGHCDRRLSNLFTYYCI